MMVKVISLKREEEFCFVFFFHPSFIFQEKKKQNKAKQKKEKFGYRVVLRHLYWARKRILVILPRGRLGFSRNCNALFLTRECPV